MKKIKSFVGDKIKAGEGDWSFNFLDISKFEKHATKSIPNYLEGHDLVSDYSSFFIKEGSIIYELGSSTGVLSKKLASRYKKKNCKIIGIDNVKKMVNFANKKNKMKNLKFRYADILKMKFQKSDVIIMYYTLQFVRPSERQKLIDKIYKSLNWGGALFLFEKVRANDARFQDYANILYAEFKLKNGFSHKEIHAKTLSLKGKLEPYSSNENIRFIKRAGFKDHTTIMKHINFEGFLAVK